MSIVEFAGGPVVKLVNLIGEIEGADAVIRPVTRAFKQLFKLGCELGRHASAASCRSKVIFS
jgi:hypothetical protein